MIFLWTHNYRGIHIEFLNLIITLTFAAEYVQIDDLPIADLFILIINTETMNIERYSNGINKFQSKIVNQRPVERYVNQGSVKWFQTDVNGV